MGFAHESHQPQRSSETEKYSFRRPFHAPNNHYPWAKPTLPLPHC
ncbi:hypothetical protein NEISICOT_01973 [Neisseria sicca ATCC 29256]|uniref:Uncharacterized protein n=1 Tax=Neisseria sicca ATCC 29256 TaxID=547045 RepID=C6M622_NEISI|nr:hypothetical protein [Neisseria sicca]EET44250.1 hypothetical protein NEISICOT_01973 [Neisseria sicca ATCC 29256]